jgi:hypothetical protein
VLWVVMSSSCRHRLFLREGRIRTQAMSPRDSLDFIEKLVREL